MVKELLKVHYSSHDLNNKLNFGIQALNHATYDLMNELLVHYSGHGWNNRPFDEQTKSHDLNTELVWYSEPHCTSDQRKKCLIILRARLAAVPH